MSALLQPMIAELNALVKTTWNLTTNVNPNYRSQRAERLNWRKLVDQWEKTGTGLTLPYVVTDVGAMVPAPEWCPLDSNVFMVDVTLYKVTGTGSESIENLETDGEALRDALNRATSHSSFQVVEDAVMDSSVDNELNQFFLRDNYPMHCVAVRFRALVGSH